MKKNEKLAAWVVIVIRGRAAERHSCTSDGPKSTMPSCQTLGHLKELKKEELVSAAMTMTLCLLGASLVHRRWYGPKPPLPPWSVENVCEW